MNLVQGQSIGRRRSVSTLLVPLYTVCLIVMPRISTGLGEAASIRPTDLILIFLIGHYLWFNNTVELPKWALYSLVAYLSAYFLGLLFTLLLEGGSQLLLAVAYVGKFTQYAVIFAVCYSYFQDENIRWWTLIAVLLTLITNSIWVLLESLKIGRPTIIGTSAIFVSGYILAFGTLVSLPLFFWSRNSDQLRALYIVCAIVCFISLVANGSRAILVGTVASIGIYTALYSYQVAAGTVGAGSLAFATIATFDLPPQRVQTLAVAISNPSAVRSIRIRLERWGAALKIWQENPLFGQGLSRVTGSAVVESQYLIFLTELGVIGSGLVVIAGLFLFRSLLSRVRSESGYNRGFAIAGTGMVSMLLISGLFSASFWAIRSMEVFSVLLALSLSEWD